MRKNPGDLIEAITSDAAGMSLFQAIYLVERLIPHGAPIGTMNDPSRELIRLRSSCSLSFPAHHIKKIAKDESGRFTIECAGLGLLGTLSPLPTQYTASLVSEQLDEEENRARVIDFVNIFDHRLLSLAYRVDEYRHIQRNYDVNGNNTFKQCMYALAGHPEGAPVDDTSECLLSVLLSSRLLFQDARSTYSLNAWLKHFFPDLLVEIEEHSPRWIPIPRNELVPLGADSCLLSDKPVGRSVPLVLGEWILDRETSFTVRLLGLDWSQFRDFLTNDNSLGRLVRLISRFAPDWLDFDLSLVLKGSECHNLLIYLDGETSRLGLTTGLFAVDGSYEDMVLSLDSRAIRERFCETNVEEHTYDRAS